MRWIIGVDRERAKAGLEWARHFLTSFDTSLLEWVRIDIGRGKYRGIYGRCWLPTKSHPTYRMSCQVPGPFPCRLVTRKRPLYPKENGQYPKAPNGCWRTKECVDPRSGRRWYRVNGTTWIRDLNEAVVWIVGHEGFHFLKGTKQVSRRDNEIEADRFADEQLATFREKVAQADPSRRKDILDLW